MNILALKNCGPKILYMFYVAVKSSLKSVGIYS